MRTGAGLLRRQWGLLVCPQLALMVYLRNDKASYRANIRNHSVQQRAARAGLGAQLTLLCALALLQETLHNVRKPSL